MGNAVRIVARIGERADPQTFTGRVAWALDNFVAAGVSGCTPITHPGPRWSDAVMKLRRQGLDVETIYERHGGAYAGNHGRYLLHSTVEILNVERAA